MPELKDLITQIRELNPKKEDFAAALRENAQPLYQVVFDWGFSAKGKEVEASTTALNAKVAEAEKALADAQKRLSDAEAKAPDLAKIRADYDAEITGLKDQIKAAKKEAKEAVHAERIKTQRAALLAEMTALGLDKDYAEIQVEKQIARVRFSEDGAVQVFQTGKEIPIQSDTPLKALADEVRQAAPAKFVSSNADTGSGVERGTGTGAGKGLYDGIRKQAVEQQAGAKGKSAAERLGFTAPAST